MSEAVIIALFSLIGTLATTIGVMALKRRYDIADRRRQEEEITKAKCARFETGFWRLMEWSRAYKQDVMAAAAGPSDEYSCARLKELASEPTPFEELCRYVENLPVIPARRLEDEKK